MIWIYSYILDFQLYPFQSDSGDKESFLFPKHKVKDVKIEGKVVRVCFFYLASQQKQDCCDVTIRAVTIWGQGRVKERVSKCATCE